MKVFISLLLVIVFVSVSCDKKKGCTERNSLNFDLEAEENDGTCRYSNVTFYANAGFYNGIPITKIDVTVNGNIIGTIPGTYYPGGPGNCSAQGTVPYQFTSGAKVDWNTKVYLASGGILFGSGEVSPSSALECIKVNVTK